MSTDNVAGELALINDKLEVKIKPTSVAKFLNIQKKFLKQKYPHKIQCLFCCWNDERLKYKHADFRMSAGTVVF